MMNDLIELLKEMGATNVVFNDKEGGDTLTFIFYDKQVIIRGVNYNDSTGGIEAKVIKSIGSISYNPNTKTIKLNG